MMLNMYSVANKLPSCLFDFFILFNFFVAEFIFFNCFFTAIFYTSDRKFTVKEN